MNASQTMVDAVTPVRTLRDHLYAHVLQDTPYPGIKGLVWMSMNVKIEMVNVVTLAETVMVHIPAHVQMVIASIQIEEHALM